MQISSRIQRRWVFVCLVVSGALATGRLDAQIAGSPRVTGTVLAIKAAEPAVVNIEGNKPSSNPTGHAAEPQQVNGMGAGVIIDSRGYILTNYHVVQDVTRIEVTLREGSKFIGKIIDHDPGTDLALIKIDAKTSLPTIDVGKSEDLMRGEPVIAIGNPFGYHDTVTEGIISALHRNIPVNGAQEYRDLIQTDASINPGNSGGPLLNAEGKMIGINAAVRVGAQGIGFAIPVDNAISIAASLIAAHRRGSIADAVEVQSRINKSGDRELYITRVLSANRLLDGDLKVGDVVTAVGDTSVCNRLEYELALMDVSPEKPVDIHYRRDGLAGHVLANLKSAPRNFSMVSAKSAAESPSIQDRVWQQLGVRLVPADPVKVHQIDANYNGGMRITDVRDFSSAAQSQLRPGDILVGLVDWQTTHWNDLEWILERSDFRSTSKPKFYIIRGRTVFWGALEPAKKPAR